MTAIDQQCSIEILRFLSKCRNFLTQLPNHAAILPSSLNMKPLKSQCHITNSDYRSRYFVFRIVSDHSCSDFITCSWTVITSSYSSETSSASLPSSSTTRSPSPSSFSFSFSPSSSSSSSLLDPLPSLSLSLPGS